MINQLLEKTKKVAENNNKKIREFKATTFALKNKNTIYLLILVIMVFGSISYVSLPKELFPEVNMPTITIETIYPGNPPLDIENLITKVIEKEIKTVNGIDKISSISTQDASLIIVQFAFGSDIKKALRDIKDAIDKIRSDLPSDLPVEPLAQDLDLSEMPIINVNLSGDYSLDELKNYAEYLKDAFETIHEISRVEIKGIEERELQINVDPLMMKTFKISFTDIENAIKSENLSISGGEIAMGNYKRSIRITGEFQNYKDIADIIVKSERGNIVYLRDFAEVKDTYAENLSYARLNLEPVVSLQIIKKGGENLLSAVDKINEKIKIAQKTSNLDKNLKISITNDQSKHVRKQISNLENSMIMGIIFVILVLFFFLGLRNALFVGVAIPLSMLLAFSILAAMGATINMMTLFSLILALGMLVDNAIVVVENIYRFIDQGYKVFDAAKLAVGEIAKAIISSTATTLASFFPLLFWHDMVGEFMRFMPITLIIVLTSSLFVALILIPIFTITFVNKDNKKERRPNKKKNLILAFSLITFGIVLYFPKNFGLANLSIVFGILILLNLFVLFDLAQWFQNVFLVKLENLYLRTIQFSLRDKNPKLVMIATVFLLFGTFVFMKIRKLDVVFFPDVEPSYVNVIAEFPIGTNVAYTDSIIKIVEKDISKLLQPYQENIESILTTVGKGAKRENEVSLSNSPNKSITTVKFVDFQKRTVSSLEIQKKLTKFFQNRYAGIEFFIEANASGPPTGYPVNIEITGKELEQMIAISDSMQSLIERAGIKGIEGLKIDIERGKPELIIEIDRDKARRFGLSTYAISMAVRTALFGKELSKFKARKDDYPIQLRLKPKYRNNLTAIINQEITFRNTVGQLLQIPISAVANIKYNTGFGNIKRLNLKRTIVLFSGVNAGYNANRINAQIRKVLAKYKLPDGYEYKMTGEQKEQAKTMRFLIIALFTAVSLIMIILVSQFNSFVKPLIIIGSVVFSTIGVFGGIATFKMPIVILFTGIGIVSLAGVVVNNAIVLIDYIDYLKQLRKADKGLDDDENLDIKDIKDCIVNAGKTRLRPVLLTAITTILGLFPLAIGVNIDFVGLFTHFAPNIFWGGNNAAFWGPMSWTVIFGLAFATFLTLIVVPVMYLLANKLKLKFSN